jgi:hypothetical protein
MSSFLNLFPKELEPGDDWDGRIFDHVEYMWEPDLEHRLNCYLFFQDGTNRPWHTDAPIRIYRAAD